MSRCQPQHYQIQKADSASNFYSLLLPLHCTMLYDSNLEICEVVTPWVHALVTLLLLVLSVNGTTEADNWWVVVLLQVSFCAGWGCRF
jgi:hypothetical protein